MRVALVAWGTRGDVQPFVCLARALADRGHDVEVLAPSNGEDMARAAGVPFRALPLDFQSMIRAEAAQRLLAAGGSGRRLFRWLGEQEKGYQDELNRVLISASESVDLIVCSVAIDVRCRAIAEARRIPLVSMHLQPHVLSWTYPSVWSGWPSLGPVVNRVSHELVGLMGWRAQREGFATLRRELGLPSPTTRSTYRPMATGESPTLLAYSQVLAPAPAEWPATVHPVGPLKLSPELRARLGEVGVPAQLERWLQAGPAPVFLGFGSMPVLDHRAMLRTIRRSLSALGVRGILAVGWNELSEQDGAGDETLIVVGDVDHDSLLPRCRAAVHHGGAGTTVASVGAGIPTLVCSVWADQPFWGARCRALGVGDTFPFTKLDVRRLTKGLETVLAPRVADRAREVALRMAEEDGVGAAVTYLCGSSGSPVLAKEVSH